MTRAAERDWQRVGSHRSRTIGPPGLHVQYDEDGRAIGASGLFRAGVPSGSRLVRGRARAKAFVPVGPVQNRFSGVDDLASLQIKVHRRHLRPLTYDRALVQCRFFEQCVVRTDGPDDVARLDCAP